MAVDAPAKIAIIGAGPIGLEAALYARYLGYEVEIFEDQSQPAAEVLFRGHLQEYVPWRQLTSPLGLAALQAHWGETSFPNEEALLTNRQWHELYLQPLASTDLLEDFLRLNTTVLRIGKVEIGKLDSPSGEYDRGAWDFRLLVDQRGGHEQIVTADVVLDCSGVSLNPLSCGHGGMRALGEPLIFSELFSYDLLNVLGCYRARYAGKKILLVGTDFPAAVAVQDICQLMPSEPGTSLTWITSREVEENTTGPFENAKHESNLLRRKLLEQANHWACSHRDAWWPGVWIEALSSQGDSIAVQLSGAREGTETFDQVISLCGFRPNQMLWSELQVDVCPRCEAARPFADLLLQREPGEAYPREMAPTSLLTSEPNFYVLGAKSFGRLPGFQFQHGLTQIRDIFRIINDREKLDLYATVK